MQNLIIKSATAVLFTNNFVTFVQRTRSRVNDSIDMKSVCKSFQDNRMELEKTKVDSKTFIKFIGIGYALMLFQAMVHFTVHRFAPNISQAFLFDFQSRTRPSAIWTNFGCTKTKTKIKQCIKIDANSAKPKNSKWNASELCTFQRVHWIDSNR